jgi:hypothetical protein
MLMKAGDANFGKQSMEFLERYGKLLGYVPAPKLTPGGGMDYNKAFDGSRGFVKVVYDGNATIAFAADVNAEGDRRMVCIPMWAHHAVIPDWYFKMPWEDMRLQDIDFDTDWIDYPLTREEVDFITQMFGQAVAPAPVLGDAAEYTQFQFHVVGYVPGYHSVQYAMMKYGWERRADGGGLQTNYISWDETLKHLAAYPMNVIPYVSDNGWPHTNFVHGKWSDEEVSEDRAKDILGAIPTAKTWRLAYIDNLLFPIYEAVNTCDVR